MEDRQIAMLIEQADRARVDHQWARAIDLLRRALSLDPDHPHAHASLALALLGARRLHGATIEAGLALAHDGNDPFCHFVAASVRVAERRLDEAWEHCLVALQADGANIDAHVLGATIHRLRAEPDQARELLLRALAIRADHVEALVGLARVEMHADRLGEAARATELALAANPADTDAHIVAGFIALRRGDIAGAEHHGRFALTQDAVDLEALELWTAIKARRSWTLGLWWRFNAYLTMRGEASQIRVLLGSFVIVRLAMIIAGALELDTVERVLSLSWWGLCAYTWTAPELFRRMLKRDLAEVALRRDF